MFTLSRVLLLIGCWSTLPALQTDGPKFEVASVKESPASYELNGLHAYPGGRVVCHGCTLPSMIEEALRLKPYQLKGGPAWIETTKYDVEGRAPEEALHSEEMPRTNASNRVPLSDKQRAMLLSLLRDRFRLEFRREERQKPIYLLTRSKSQLKLEPTKAPNADTWAGGASGTGDFVGDGIAGRNEAMPDLASRLSGRLDRSVLDKTGLVGAFDFHVEYQQPDGVEPELLASIVTSLHELGLDLRPAMGPVTTIVIERVEKPSAN